MHTFLGVLMGVLLLSVLGVLAAGFIGMIRETDPRRSNKLMQWRVILQGVAILLFATMMMMFRS